MLDAMIASERVDGSFMFSSDHGALGWDCDIYLTEKSTGCGHNCSSMGKLNFYESILRLMYTLLPNWGK